MSLSTTATIVPATIPSNERLIALVNLVQAVNDRLNQYYQHWLTHEQLQIASKLDESPITEADLAAHDMIEQCLQAITPDIPILSEESASFDGRHDWQHFWLVDPLDGTREFINKTGEFTVNIALIDHGNVVLSMIGVPTLHRIYMAEKDGPVYRVDTASGVQQWYQLSPAAVHTLQPWRVAITRRSDRPAYNAFKQALSASGQAYSIKNAGSAYKFCLMVEGEIDVYPRLHPTAEWDTAAGQGLLEAIGGGVYDVHGRLFRYNQRDILLNDHFVAVRSHLYRDAALQVVRQVD